MELFSRRTFMLGAPSAALPLLLGSGFLAACASEDQVNTATSVDEKADSTSGVTNPPEGGAEPTSSEPTTSETTSRWRMPAEEDPHERTWMCWPSSEEVWGPDLTAVQDAIVDIAQAIARFEPVTMLARPSEMDALGEILTDNITLMEGTVDDLWARDTLANFVVRTSSSGKQELAAAHATFNGWGGKQIHDGDTQLAALVAKQLGVELIDVGLVGEGGGVEIDGTGTVLAAASCWVNDNRNPGKSREEIEAALLEMLGGDRMIWVDGLAGADITDGHIDTLARFANPSTIVVDKPAFDDPSDPWVAVAATTKAMVSAATTVDGEPYQIVEIVQPTDIRGGGEGFLSTYMNYYVCNGAVIAPQFGDPAADDAAEAVLAGLFPDRQIVMLDIDALAAGGGGIHCATQQQPRID
jgi:agmatine deiminase